MSKPGRRRSAAPRKGERRSSSGASYNVGYGKPPKQHQFQPGQSRQSERPPKGREEHGDPAARHS